MPPQSKFAKPANQRILMPPVEPVLATAHSDQILPEPLVKLDHRVGGDHAGDSQVLMRRV